MMIKNSFHCTQNLCQHAFSFFKEHWKQNLRNVYYNIIWFQGFWTEDWWEKVLEEIFFFSYFVSWGLNQKISIEYSKRWVELNHTHNFWYFFTFILILISWNLYSYSKLEVLIVIFILIILNNTYDFVLI